MFAFFKRNSKSKVSATSQADETKLDAVFNELNKREQQLIDQLSSSPVVEITGLVDVSGVGARRVGKESLWTMTLKFEAWRIGNGEMEKNLTVRCKVADKEMKKLKRKIKADSIIRIQGRVLRENLYKSPQALMEEYVQSKVDDVEIKNYLVEICKPVIIEDDVLGTLKYTRESGEFTATNNWGNQKISLSLDIEDMDDLDAVKAAAHILYEDQETWNKRIVDYAVRELLPLKNECWLEENEAKLTEEQFKEKMELDSISVRKDGLFQFWHGDGNMFFEHSILIEGSIIDGPQNADIPG